MINIVLRSGKVLQYNDVGNCAEEGNCIVLRDYANTGLIARIPTEIVERAEFETPCVLKRAKTLKQIRRKYEG